MTASSSNWNVRLTILLCVLVALIALGMLFVAVMMFRSASGAIYRAS